MELNSGLADNEENKTNANRVVAEAVAKAQAERISMESGLADNEENKTNTNRVVAEAVAKAQAERISMESGLADNEENKTNANRVVAEAVAKAQAERISMESVSNEVDNDNEESAVNTGVADFSSSTTVTDGVHQAELPAATAQAAHLVRTSASQLTRVIPASENTCQPLQAVSAVSSAGQMSGISKGQAFVLCQVTSGGQTIIVPRSAFGSIQLSSGASATSTSSVTRVPVFQSATPLRTISSHRPAVAALTSASPSAATIAVAQTSGGVLLRPAASGIRVIAGTNNVANRAGSGVTLNRGITPQRLAVALAPASSTLRPTGTGSIRLVAIRNSTPLAVGGIRASGSVVATPQLKLLTSAVPLSGVKPLTSVSTAVTAVASSVQASPSTVTAVRQQTAVNDVQAYLRRIEELKSSQPEQGTKAPAALTTTVRTPLKAKTVLPTLTSAQQIVVVQSGSQPQLANISASQLVSMFVVVTRYLLLYFVYS